METGETEPPRGNEIEPTLRPLLGGRQCLVNDAGAVEEQFRSIQETLHGLSHGLGYS
jgi:hypothetical protein